MVPASRARRALLTLAAAAVAIGAAGAGTAAAETGAPVRTAAGAGSGAEAGSEPGERLSDERRLSYWAFAEQPGPILAEPEKGAALVAKARFATELGRPEVYLVLRRFEDEAERVWLQVRVPKRPNGQVGWVREEVLGEPRVNRDRLVIALGARRASLYKKGKRVWSAPVGIGRGGTPTPRGSFYVRERMRLGRGGGPYGSFAFGTSAYSPGLSDWPAGGVIGIHGTDEPGLIPGRVSHGCVRMRNGDINRLRRLMGIGTPVLIR